MIPPGIHDFINDTVVQRSLLSYGMVCNTDICNLIAQVLNRECCVGLVPLNKERLGAFSINTAVTKLIQRSQRLCNIFRSTYN